MIKGVLFDLDGTTVDTVGDINLALNKALGTSFTDNQCNRFVGNGLLNLMKLAIKEAGMDESKTDYFYSELLRHYHDCPVKYSHPYPGVSETLKILVKNQVKIGIFSNKDEDLVKIVLASCFPDIHFDFIAGRKGNFAAKPNPEAVLAFCDEMGFSKDELLYVGDSEVDWKCGTNAGVKTRIILGGTRSREDLLACGVETSSMMCSMADILSLFH